MIWFGIIVNKIILYAWVKMLRTNVNFWEIGQLFIFCGVRGGYFILESVHLIKN